MNMRHHLVAGLSLGLIFTIGCKPKPTPPAQPAPANPTAQPSKPGEQPAGATSAQPTQPEPAKSKEESAPAATQPAAPAEMKSASTTETAAAGTELVVPGLKFIAPTSWTSRKPSNSMRVAEYVIPAETGEAELVAFYFGAGQGGAAQANIDRWLGQFQNPADPGKPVEGKTATFEQDGLKLSVLRASGTYAPGAMGPNAPKPEPRPDSALFGIIVEGGPQGSVFIKITGPQTTLTANDAILEAVAKSVKRAS